MPRARRTMSVALLAVIATVTIAVPLYSQGASNGILTNGGDAPDNAPRTIRCVTYNVLAFSGFPTAQSRKHFKSTDQRINEFAEVFASLDGDIFALQESPSAELVQGVAKKLNLHAARTAEGGASGGSILSRFPIIEFETYKSHKDNTGQVFTHHFWRALLDVGGGQQIMVFGTHLNPVWNISGEIRRLREVNAIITIMKQNEQPDVPQILMGDFNNYGETQLRYVQDAGFRDAWDIAPTGGKYTCNSIHQYCRVDRVYITAAWSDGIISAGAVRNKLTSPTQEEVPFLYSDHLPVRAEFVLQPPRAEIATGKPRADLTIEIDDRDHAMKWIPAGEFMMGHYNGASINQPPRSVTLSKGFWVLDHEVTESLWHAVMKTSEAPSEQNADRPVVNVSRADCQMFVERMNRIMPDYEFNLPTEAQWEYVARAGRADIPGDQLTGSPSHNQPAGHKPHRISVMDSDANAWGIHGMMSNVREWCRDAYDGNALTFLPNVDPINRDDNAKEYSIRGSSYLHEYGGGVVTRLSGDIDHRDAITGFRIIATPKAK